MSGKPDTKEALQPEGKVRRSQMLTSYGPGALVDLLDYAVIVNGLDFWKYGKKEGIEVVEEPRLRERLTARFKKLGRDLRVEGAFRTPPAGDDARPSPYHGVTARLFPRWFVCQRCRALVRYDGLEFRGGRFLHGCHGKGVECVPVRFVQACPSGHVDDLNWIGVAHQGPPCDAPSLRLQEGVTGDFSEVRVECETCRKSRWLIDLKQPETRPKCRGTRPWLGPEGEEACEQPATLIVRTASSAYFSQTDSALSIPEKENALHEAVLKHKAILLNATAATLSAFRTIPQVGADVAPWTDAQVLDAVELIKAGKKPERPPIRTAEFQRFVEAEWETPGQIPPPGVHFFARRAKVPALPGVERVVLAHKLREVRVQVGFTRLDFPTPTLQGEHDLGVRSAPVGLNTDWLPAVEVFGEGLFLRLDEQAVQAWEARPEVQAREAALRGAFDAAFSSRDVPPPFPGARFYLLHSLAHLLVTAVSLECGYSASAIRERIYCAPATDAVPMAAILLSTGTPGTEGTLGGLVQQGRDVHAHLRHAMRLGRLCSNDPVCAAHDPLGPTERRLEGAACHGCLFTAESSCEWFNRYLDRALVVPCLGRPAALAFFGDGEWPQT